MPDTTDNLSMPYILPAQAQKHVTHNEALQILDAVVQLSVEEFGLNDPPTAFAEGQVWAIGAAPTGDWASQPGRLAMRALAGWVFIQPREGWRAWDRSGETMRVYQGTDWAAQALQNVGGLGIGTAFDTTNRLSVVSPATLLSHAGSDHRLIVNKASPSDTASLLFQSAWSGHAEMGLSGSDAFSVKVSADGSNWNEGLSLDPATGRSTLSGGITLPVGSASAPSLSFVGDTDTGLSRTADNEIGISAGGVVRARFGASDLQLDVPLTGTAVTQSMTDTTAGRITRVGDFGIGLDDGSLIDPGDMDGHRISGFFRWASTTVGRPPTSAGVFMHLTRLSGVEHVQMGFGTNDRIYRRRWNTTWSPWQEIFHQGSVLGPVSQTAGVPTGAVIERGSNANGDFTRFADGTQMCWRVAPAVACQTAQGALFMNATLQAWTFPAAFAVGTLPSVSGTGGSTARFMGGTGSSNTSFSYRVLSAYSDATLSSPHLMAIGRWF